MAHTLPAYLSLCLQILSWWSKNLKFTSNIFKLGLRAPDTLLSRESRMLQKSIAAQTYYLFQPMTQELFLLCLFNSEFNTRNSLWNSLWHCCTHFSPLWKIDLCLDDLTLWNVLLTTATIATQTTETSVGSANITVIFILIWIGCNMPGTHFVLCYLFTFICCFMPQIDQTLVFAKSTLNTRIKHLADVFVLSPQHGQSSWFADSISANLYTC